MAMISNNLFKQANEAFSPHSTKRPFLPEPASTKTKEVSNLMKLIQVSNFNKKRMLKATHTWNLQRIVRAEIPFQVFH